MTKKENIIWWLTTLINLVIFYFIMRYEIYWGIPIVLAGSVYLTYHAIKKDNKHNKTFLKK